MKIKCLVLFIFLLSGCQSPEVVTFVPERAISTSPSFDGNVANSGLLGFIPDKGFELTDSATERYKGLTEKFDEKPIGLSKDDSKNILTKEGMMHFLELVDKDRNNK